MDGKIREIEEYYKDADVTWHDAMDVANRALDDIPYLLTHIKELEARLSKIKSDTSIGKLEVQDWPETPDY